MAPPRDESVDWYALRPTLTRAAGDSHCTFVEAVFTASADSSIAIVPFGLVSRWCAEGCRNDCPH